MVRRGLMAQLVGCCCFVAAVLALGVAGRPGDFNDPATYSKPDSQIFNRYNQPDFRKRNSFWQCDEYEDRPWCILQCPDLCPDSCEMSCSGCRTWCRCIGPGAACGDPSFTGGDGNTFYFHGSKAQNFCIVSDIDLHINAHFIGNHNPAIKRNFTWIQALGVRFSNHRFYVGARRAVKWQEDEDHIEITFDGEPVNVDTTKKARWVSKVYDGLSVKHTDTVNTVVVELDGVFSISAHAVPITEEDSRIHNYGKTRKDSLMHLDLHFKFHSLTDIVDGVLGQTYRPNYVNRLNISAKMPIMGGARKYLSSSLFSTDCVVSKFHSNSGASHVIATTS